MSEAQLLKEVNYLKKTVTNYLPLVVIYVYVVVSGVVQAVIIIRFSSSKSEINNTFDIVQKCSLAEYSVQF